ncbi:MAG: hypothetical protein ABTQ28_04895 [Thauera sp.]
MSLDSFATIPDLLAGLLAEQRATTEAITRLAATLAGLRTKADGATKTVKGVITKPAAALAEAPAGEQTSLVPEPAAVISTRLEYKADVAPTFAKLLAAKGAPAVVALLATFGVKKGVELTAEQLPEALAAATLALGE